MNNQVNNFDLYYSPLTHKNNLLTMKTAFITGANKGIGFETAKQLAGKGYYIFLGSRNIEKGIEAVDQLKAAGLQSAEPVQIDISDEVSIERAFLTLSSKSPMLDILINNAGISGGFPQHASSTDILTIRKVFDTNFFGTIQVNQVFMPLLKKSDNAVIVNVTSGLASLTMHSDPNWKYYPVKSAAYGPSKTALNAYTIALAYELRDTAIKVNAVDPGYTDTDFNNHTGTLHVTEAARQIIQYAILEKEGPRGKFFSRDNDSESGESKW